MTTGSCGVAVTTGPPEKKRGKKDAGSADVDGGAGVAAFSCRTNSADQPDLKRLGKLKTGNGDPARGTGRWMRIDGRVD